jgi:hypothetical protein
MRDAANPPQQIGLQGMYIVLFQVGVTCYDNKQQYKSSVEQYRMMSEQMFIVCYTNVECLRKNIYTF